MFEEVNETKFPTLAQQFKPDIYSVSVMLACKYTNKYLFK
jgi:hypothetical protein